jgi:hypothetical protein
MAAPSQGKYPWSQLEHTIEKGTAIRPICSPPFVSRLPSLLSDRCVCEQDQPHGISARAMVWANSQTFSRHCQRVTKTAALWGPHFSLFAIRGAAMGVDLPRALPGGTSFHHRHQRMGSQPEQIRGWPPVVQPHDSTPQRHPPLVRCRKRPSYGSMGGWRRRAAAPKRYSHPDPPHRPPAAPHAHTFCRPLGQEGYKNVQYPPETPGLHDWCTGRGGC